MPKKLFQISVLSSCNIIDYYRPRKIEKVFASIYFPTKASCGKI